MGLLKSCMWEKNNAHIHAFHFPDKDWATQRSVSGKFRLIRETIPGPGRRAPGRPGSRSHRPRRPLCSPAPSQVPLTPLPASAAWPAGQRLQKRRQQNVIIGLIPWKLQVKSRLGLGAAPFPARLFGGIERQGQKGRGEGRRPRGEQPREVGPVPAPRPEGSGQRGGRARDAGTPRPHPRLGPGPAPPSCSPSAPQPPSPRARPGGGRRALIPAPPPPPARPFLSSCAPPGPCSARPRAPSGVGGSAQSARCAARVPSSAGGRSPGFARRPFPAPLR